MNTIIEKGTHSKIPLADKVGYGSGNFPTGVAIQVVGAYLVFYCTAILGIPGSLVGVAVSIGIIWDAVTDPLMGYFSDMTQSKTFGRRHLYLLIGGIGIAITNFILWNMDSTLSVYAKYAIIFIDLLAYKSFLTIYVTPYTALGAELSNDYNERTSIQGIKTVFFLLGIIFVSVVGMYIFFQPTAQYGMGQLNPKAYNNMGLFSSLIIVVFTLVCFFTTKQYIPLLNQTVAKNIEKPGIKNLIASFKRVLLNKAFRYVAMAYMFNNLASALLSNLGLHVFTYTFMLNSQQIAVIVGVQFLTSILSQPIWLNISKKIDKKPSMRFGILICILGSVVFFIFVLMKNIVQGSAICFFPFAILAGFGTGGLFTLPLSMVADVIDLDELNAGTRAEGTYYGCLTLFYKLSQSLALFAIGFILDLVRFDSSLPIQAESTVVILGVILALGSGLSFAAAFISLNKYNLDRASVENIQKQLGSR